MTSDFSTKIAKVKTALEAVFVKKSDITDNLTSTDTNKPLSAKQGKALNDGKADTNHTQASSTVTESSALGRIGTSQNATQHDINLAINNIINTGGGSGGDSLLGVSDYYLDSTTEELVLEYSTGKLISSVTKSTSGLVDTYTITYTDSSTYEFTVTNGQDGSGGSVDIVTSTNGWNSTTSDSKVPSEKLVKNSPDNKISKSSTTGLVKNDGSIDTNTYLTTHQTLPTIADNLTTNDATQVLSAKQGKVLDEKIGNIITIINGTGSS